MKFPFSLLCRFGFRPFLLVVTLFATKQLAYSVAESASKGVLRLAEGKELMERRQFFLAEPKLLAAEKCFRETGEIGARTEALFLLNDVYSKTLQQKLRVKNLEACFTHVARFYTPESPETAECHLMKAAHFLESGRAGTAETHLLDKFPNLISDQDYLIQAKYQTLLGRAYQKQFKFSKAMEAFEKALEICIEHLPENIGLYADILEFTLFSNLLSRPAAMGTYFDTLVNKVSSGPEMTTTDSLILGRCHYYRGVQAWIGGNFGNAIANGEKALGILRQTSIRAKEYIGASLSLIANLYKIMRKSELANKSFREANVVLQNPSSKSMANIYYFSLLYSLYDNPLREQLGTKEILEKARVVVEKWSLNPYFYFAACSLVELEEGNYERSLSWARKSLTALGQESVWVAPQLWHKGYAHLMTGYTFVYLQQFDSAALHYHKSIIHYSTDFDSEDWADYPNEGNHFLNPNVVNATSFKAACFFFLSQRVPHRREYYLKMAYAGFKAATRISWQMRRRSDDEISKMDLARRTKYTYQRTACTALELWEVTGDPNFLIEAFNCAENSKGLMLLESQLEATARKKGLIPAELLQKGEDLKREAAFFQGQLLDEKTYGEKRDTSHIAWLTENSLAIKEQLKAWRDSVQSVYPNGFQFEDSPPKIFPKQVRDSILSPGEVLVEFSVGDLNLITFLISHEEFRAYSIPLPRDFNAKVSLLRKSISEINYVDDSVAEGYRDFVSTARWLYEVLLQPIMESGMEISRLLIVPDKSLAQIPFEVLLTEPVDRKNIDYTSLPYLLHKCPIRYAFSATSLLELKRTTQQKEQIKCLAMAPEYGNGLSRGKLEALRNSTEPLEGTQQEVAALSRMGVEGDFLFGNSATEKRFKMAAPEYNLLHLAMHGKADKDEPLKSGLQFTKQMGDSTEDHVLHSYELAALSLDADLVVLSACESGIGRFAAGEGELSLARDFLANGSRSVIATLWNVNDRSSALLMELFYQELTSGKSPGRALHEAKLRMLNQADSRTSHPYFWAGYIALGSSNDQFRIPTFYPNPAVWGTLILALVVLYLILRYSRFIWRR